MTQLAVMKLFSKGGLHQYHLNRHLANYHLN